MDSKTLSDFKKDLLKCFENIAQQFPEATDMLKNELESLGKKYPALQEEEDKRVDEESKDNKRLMDIENELRNNKSNEALRDYTGIEQTLKSNNPEECIESIQILQNVINTSRRKILHYSLLQGKFFLLVKDTTTSQSFTTLVNLTQLSKSYANFLIRMYKLTDIYNQLMYVSLPIGFFLKNFKQIKKICEKNETEWK